jgi:hypothetical protein
LVIKQTEDLIHSSIDSVNDNIEHLLHDEHIIHSLKNSMYPYLKPIYDELMTLEAIKEARKKTNKQISLNGLATYHTHEFNSSRCQTSFDTNFNRADPNSMLLFNAMHGGVILDKDNNPIIKDCVKGGFLNKFSTSGMGQCSLNSNKEQQYIVYSMCDAVAHGHIIDMPVIFREANTHRHLTYMHTPAEKYIITKPNIERQRDSGLAHQNECTARNFGELKYGDLLGDETHKGDKYLEKIYSIEDKTEVNGVFICKDWPEIGAKQMDNLLENLEFRTFILEKYLPTEGDDVYDRLELTRSIIDYEKKTVVIGNVLLSDVIEFCEAFGKLYISMVDDSCSVFKSLKHPYTGREISMIVESIRQLKGIAKGVNKTKRRGNKRNKTKRRGNKRNKTKRKSLH